MGDFDNAVQCHMEHLQIAKRLGNKVEEARAYSNLGKLASARTTPFSKVGNLLLFYKVGNSAAFSKVGNHTV